MKLSDNKQTILSYVESRMTFIAPNLSVIVGASTAAKLMGLAGGLTNLTKMPSCNILLLGARKKLLGGFSTTAAMPHAGAIFYSKIVQDCPAVSCFFRWHCATRRCVRLQDLRMKAARLVSCKVTLAARVDSFHESAQGQQGKALLSDIERRLEKLQEPPPVKAVKALAPPIDSGRKKRGGRRHRKMKERLGMTELRVGANRTGFGKVRESIGVCGEWQRRLVFRSKRMRIKKIWAFRLVWWINRAQAKFARRKSIPKPKREFRRNFRFDYPRSCVFDSNSIVFAFRL